MFNDKEDKIIKVNLEMTLEQIEFIHYVVTCLRNNLYNEITYYYVVRNLEKSKIDYKKCNDILELFALAHKKFKED